MEAAISGHPDAAGRLRADTRAVMLVEPPTRIGWRIGWPLFEDRRHAGRVLADEVRRIEIHDPVVVGLARGGVQVAAEIAATLHAPLDVLAVRKVGHPWQPEYALGAVTPGGGLYVRGPEGLTPGEFEAVISAARERAEKLDERLHARHARVRLNGRSALLVDDGLATGATMIAAVRWARAAGAARVVVAVPVGATGSLELIREEADAVVCPHGIENFMAVGVWYGAFDQVADEDVLGLLDAGAREDDRG